MRRLLALLGVVASNPAFAAADAFLCTPDGEWVGESTDSAYRNCQQFEWIAFGAALEPPPEAGIPGSPSSMLGPLVFQGHLDSLTPTLVTQAATGASFDVDLYVRPPGSPNWSFKVSYVDAVVGDLAVAGTTEVATVTVTLRARTITYTARTLDGSGNVTGSQTVTWTAP